MPGLQEFQSSEAEPQYLDRNDRDSGVRTDPKMRKHSSRSALQLHRFEFRREDHGMHDESLDPFLPALLGQDQNAEDLLGELTCQCTFDLVRRHTSFQEIIPSFADSPLE